MTLDTAFDPAKIRQAAQELDKMPVRSYDQFELELDAIGINPTREQAQSLIDRCPPHHRVSIALRGYLAALDGGEQGGDVSGDLSFTPLT